YPTSYAGAVRIRVIPINQDPNVPHVTKRTGEVTLMLEATGEPRMLNFGVIGNAMIDKAVDDLGQSLFVAMADPMADNVNEIVNPNGVIIRRTTVYNPYMNATQRHVVVRLKAGD